MSKTEAKDSGRVSDLVRWQLDVPAKRNDELDRFMAEYGFTTRKDLINTSLTFLQWAVNEVRTGRIIASVDEQNSRYKQLHLPVFDVAASAVKPAAIVSVMQSELDSLTEAAPQNEEVRIKTEAVRVALENLAAAV